MSDDVHPLAWAAIMNGQPWVCTEAEQRAYDATLWRLALFSPRARGAR